MASKWPPSHGQSLPAGCEEARLSAALCGALESGPEG